NQKILGFFCDCLITFSIKFLRSVNIVACDRISFLFKAEKYSIVCIHCILYIHSSADGHLGCFQLLAVVNNAATNMHMQILLQDPAFHSSEYISKSSITGSYGNSSFNFFSTNTLFFFQLYSMVTQLHIHVYILFSHVIMLHHK
uniref:Uncharacterized protein n=1 Tax=Sus scrofa TaxID=9823 RepID=A0A8D1IA41_PIG